MIIRCERCSTLYELDEALLSPEGSSVQCTRCQAVFVAFPARAPGRTAVGMPSADELARPPPPAATSAAPGQAVGMPTDPPAAEAPPPASPPPAPVGPVAPVKASPRPARPGPAVYRPPPPAAPSKAAAAATRAAVPRRDAVGAFEARLRAGNAWKRLLLPAAVVALGAAAVGAWSLWQRRPDPETQRQRVEAQARIAQDDRVSLEQAVRLLDGVVSRPHSPRAALAERALARILLAAAELETAEPLATRLAARRAEAERLAREPAPGSEETARAIAEEANRLDAEMAPHRTRAAELSDQAVGELRELLADPLVEAVAARGLAVHFAMAGDRDQTERYVELARRAGPDSWSDLALAWIDVQEREGRPDRAMARLAEIVRARPELIRARFVLARTQLAAGKREAASATLDRLLAANPRHERAARLRAEIQAPPPPAAAPPPPAPLPAPPPKRVWPVPPAAAAPAVAAPAVSAPSTSPDPSALPPEPEIEAPPTPEPSAPAPIPLPPPPVPREPGGTNRRTPG